MRTTLLTASALAALITLSPALAQDATNDATTPAPPAATDPAAPVLDAAPATPDNQAATTPTPDANAAAPQSDVATTAAPATGEKFLAQQADTEILASSLIGQTVYSQADENLGNINDIVFSKDGGIDAVVVGVGGFLGIGEKSVAIAYSNVQAMPGDDGSVKLVLNTTKEELDAAPGYTTVAMLKQQQQMEQQQPATDQGLGTTAPVAPSPAQ
jgi:sporulation protein YlmC with PRC-barrel domain